MSKDKDPWWGDPGFRVIPADATEADVEIYHLHIDPSFGRKDLNCVLPLKRLATLVEGGEIGSVSPRHYSFMGYVLDASKLLQESVPAMVQGLQEDQVDLALAASMAPAQVHDSADSRLNGRFRRAEWRTPRAGLGTAAPAFSAACYVSLPPPSSRRLWISFKRLPGR